MGTLRTLFQALNWLGGFKPSALAVPEPFSLRPKGLRLRKCVQYTVYSLSQMYVVNTTVYNPSQMYVVSTTNY